MLRKKVVIFAVLSLFVFALYPRVGGAGDFAIGTAVGNFSLPDTHGKVQSLNELKGKNGAVVVFLSAQCPVVRAYNDRLNQLAADYQAKGINFIGINSNSSESPERVKSHAE
ncbi:MAG: redoxin domain-containing protein, partial [Acidobacteriota bacterium]